MRTKPFESIFLDLDRTLLDTSALVTHIWDFLAAQYDIDAATEKERRENFYTYAGDMYDYDFFAHLRTLKVGRTDRVEAELLQYLRLQPLLFDDAKDAIRELKKLGSVQILTFGNERYQMLKIAAAPDLSGLPVTIVGEHKKNFLSKLPKKHYAIVDDKDLSGTLPGNVAFILLDRKQNERITIHKKHHTVSSLRDVTTVLNRSGV